MTNQDALAQAGLSQRGDLQLPFNANTTWAKNRGFIDGTHEGIDGETITGTPVRAMVAGLVVNVERGHTQGDQPPPSDVPPLGNSVTVHTGGHADQPLVGFEHQYAHLAEVHVCAGQLVAAGDLLGVSGDTGNSAGPHLHVEVRPFGTRTATEDNPHGMTDWSVTDPSTQWQGHTLYQGRLDFEPFLPADTNTVDD